MEDPNAPPVPASPSAPTTEADKTVAMQAAVDMAVANISGAPAPSPSAETPPPIPPEALPAPPVTEEPPVGGEPQTAPASPAAPLFDQTAALRAQMEFSLQIIAAEKEMVQSAKDFVHGVHEVLGLGHKGILARDRLSAAVDNLVPLLDRLNAVVTAQLAQMSSGAADV